jgi:hypothetical protein
MFFTWIALQEILRLEEMNLHWGELVLGLLLPLLRGHHIEARVEALAEDVDLEYVLGAKEVGEGVSSVLEEVQVFTQ